ncbi:MULTISPECIES: DUF805 domain-containing protein [Henriciella]|jgi:uncharacterized membrane protein YhaH (DUF805 family)|uniref:DUF805 domain-containing protein n=1 Tax=Henriciella TaxID=453849 RepID=UPI003517E009
MGNLLFNPQGRILKHRFWQGLVILTVASVLFQAFQVRLGPALGVGGMTVFFLLGLLLLYAEVCVYAKRFHDAGTTGWWILAVWIGSFIISMIMSQLFGSVFLGERGAAIEAEVAERLAQGEFMVAIEASTALAEMVLPLTLITIVVSAVVMGFIVGSLKTQPGQNKHGPVPGEEWQDF